MSTPDKTTSDPDQSNDDGLDLTTPNDNQELDRINNAVQAAEPSFTLNYEAGAAGNGAEDEPAKKDDSSLKQ